MRFIEHPGLLSLFVARRGCLYRQLPLPTRLAMRLLRRAGLQFPNFRRLEIGDLERATGIRAHAYARAEARLPRTLAGWTKSVGARLGLDFDTLVEKALFEAEFDRHVFAGVAARYAEEHPEQQHHLHLASPLPVDAPGNLDISTRRGGGWAAFIGGLAALPFVLLYHRRFSVRAEAPPFDQALVCAVSDRVTLAMFRALFSDHVRPRFVVERDYMHMFTPSELTAEGVAVLGLSRERLRGAWKFLPDYLGLCLTWARALAPWGGLPARMLHVLMQGYAVTISGRNNVFVTFEHLTLPRAVRNEVLRAEGNASVFVTKNSYVTYQFYAAERTLNYDAFCASGPHAPRLYRRKHAKTPLFFEVGSYDTHAPEAAGTDVRRQKLSVIKGGARLITILSPGLCDENFSHEKRLALLAARLAELPDVRVMLRLKPGTDHDIDFYRQLLGTSPVHITTASEFALFDFVGPTDLFVTSISTSACDIALRGGAVAFVDFLHTPDIYLPWEASPGVVLPEAGAFERLVAWLADAPDGPIRAAHRQAMERFVADLGHRRASFAAYRHDVLASLAPLLGKVTARENAAA